MKRPSLTLIAVQAAAVAGLLLAVWSGRLPLGVPGEWTWQRPRVAATPIDLATAAAGVVGFATVAGLGMRSLARGVSKFKEIAWVATLFVAAATAQAVVQSGAPEGYGLAKWAFALSSPGASGYHTVADRQMTDPWRFWRDYPSWIVAQDAYHIGTHPPGLFLYSRAILGAMRARPDLADLVMAATPSTVVAAFGELGQRRPIARAERAAMTASGVLILLACSATVVPLYALVRASRPAAEAWATAVLWPLATSAILFQPTFDAAFPLLSTSALAAATGRRRASKLLAGMLLGVGMQFTLAFLPIGLTVAAITCSDVKIRWKLRILDILIVGIGFLSLTAILWAISGAGPLAIWWANQRNHARFYVANPRSYGAWVGANLAELAVGIGLPAAVAGPLGATRGGRAAWSALAVVLILNFSGRNLSEVGRLWLPLMPPLLAFAGAGLVRMGVGSRGLAVVLALVGLQAAGLQAMVQTVYPT